MLKINKFVLITLILVVLIGAAFVNSKYGEAHGYLGESYTQIHETIEQIEQIIELQPSENIFWITEGNQVIIIEQIEESYYNESTGKDETIKVNVTLAKVDKRLTEIVDDQRWIEIRDSLKDLQNKINSTQVVIEDYNSMQNRLAQMAGYIDEDNDEQEIIFGNMEIESFFNESEIINSYANENNLNPLDVTISDVVAAGYVFKGILILGVGDEFRDLAYEIRDKDMNEISPSFLDMKSKVNEIAKKVNGVYGNEIISFCEDECIEGTNESIDEGTERECYDSNQDSCLEWILICKSGYTQTRNEPYSCVAV